MIGKKAIKHWLGHLLRNSGVAIMLRPVSTLTLADYALPVSATVRADLAFRTFQMDQENEFLAASTLVSIYIKAVGLAEAKIIANEYLCVIYRDGQIAKFKVISLRSSIDVRFESIVPAVPTNSERLAEFDIPRAVEFVRSDSAISEDIALFNQQKIKKVPSITIIQYTSYYYTIDWNWGGGCALGHGQVCENRVLQRDHGR